jgi:hypothetical protein
MARRTKGSNEKGSRVQSSDLAHVTGGALREQINDVAFRVSIRAKSHLYDAKRHGFDARLESFPRNIPHRIQQGYHQVAGATTVAFAAAIYRRPSYLNAATPEGRQPNVLRKKRP